MKCAVTILVAIAVIAMSQSALATPLFGFATRSLGTLELAGGTSLQVNDSQGFAGPIVEATSGFVQPIALSEHVTGALGVPPNVVIVDQFGAATAFGSISGGAIHTFSEASAPNGFICAGSSCDGTKLAQAESYGLWSDTLVVGGPTNSRVTLRITNHVSGFVANTPDSGAEPQSFGLTFFRLVDNTVGGASVDFQHSLIGEGVLNVTDVQFITVSGGDTLTLETQLDTVVHAGTQNGVASATSSFLDTAEFFLDVLTPGATLETASHLDYATPPTAVPEPTSLLLLGSGLVGFGAAAWSHHRIRASIGDPLEPFGSDVSRERPRTVHEGSSRRQSL